ncbi:MAG TPA: glycosyltransferase family 39 protein [Xanthobacteraceae bacterium]|nr:glycosyltransferase family 39 protein [Xanthobacteraceae bacterium]
MAPATAAPLSGVLNWIEQRPKSAFGAVLALHFVVWTALPALLYANLPLDLIEALIYGRQWQLGYDKLPPLPWWLVEIAHRLFGADVAYYALAQGCVVIAFALVFATARPLVGAVGALFAVLVIDGMHYFQYTAVKFNHDVVQLPFWTLAGYALYFALKRGSLWHWFLLGVAFGGALWAKYFVIVLAVPYALFVLFDPQARRALATPGPWLALVVALVVASPHLIWLVQTDFEPFAYASHRATAVRGWSDHLWHPAVFAAGQFFFLLPSLFVAAALFWPRPKISPLPQTPPLPLVGRGWGGGSGRSVANVDNCDVRTANVTAVTERPDPPPYPPSQGGRENSFDRRIVALLAFGPGLGMIALTAVSGRGTVAMWGYPLWLFVGLWIVMIARTTFDTERIARVVAAWATIFVIFVAVFVVNYAVLPFIDHRYRAVLFPGDALGASLTRRFHDATGTPLRYVIGTMWDGGNLAHYSPDQPQVLIDGGAARAPWLDLADLRKKGAVVVWTQGDPTRLPAQFVAVAADAAIGTPFDLPMRRGPGSVHVGWAILKPH